MMKKIIVIGCPGSGKTTFSKKLTDKTGLPLFHLDQIWHKSDSTHIPREEFDAKLGEILALDAWIIDGNYGRTLERRLQACGTVFLFDLPTSVCLDGVISRIGKARSDLPWVETELEPDFKKQIEEFGDKELPKIYALLEKHGFEKDVVIFKSRLQADEYIEKL